MANQKIAYADTDGYHFEIWAIDPPFSPSAYEFTVASWSIRYEALDASTPGFVPAICDLEALITQGALTQNLRNILEDAGGMYFLQITQGVNDIYRGFLTPDLGSIEVRNGQRFIKLVASDGFQMLEKSSQIYQFSGVRPFTTQLYEIFLYFDFWDVFRGFAISEHYAPSNAVDTTKGGLYWTGCIQEGLYYKDNDGKYDYRTFRQVLEDICVTWGLQLFQDKGYLVFRTILEKTPSWYNVYGTSGSFFGQVTTGGTTVTTDVYTDGTELYKPATRQVFITHDQVATDYIRSESATYKARYNYYVADVTPTGANHMDYFAELRARATVQPGYPFQTVEFTFYVYIQFGPYWWNGTAWSLTQTANQFKKQRNIQNVTGSPTIEDFQYSINNFHTGDLPNIGSEPLYITVEAIQTLGDDLDGFATTSTMVFVYHGDNPNATIYYADNTKRRNGVDVSLNTTIADRWQSSAIATPVAGEIRRFLDATRATNAGNLYWDADNNLLATKVAVELGKSSFKPQQYYELELNTPVSYNHTLTWGGVDYKPLNLSYDQYGTNVTYRQWVYGDILTDPNNNRPDQEI